MRLVFAGTPEFAVATLRALYESQHEIVAVYTQPDRPSGRGQKLRPSAVKQAALALNLRLIQVEDFKSEEAIEELRSLGAEAMIVVAYGLLLAQRVLDLFPAACWNLHASLLPRWRGAAPIARAIEAGDCETGVAVMKMEKGLDTGPVLIQAIVPIGSTDNAMVLQAKLAERGAALMLEALNRIERLHVEPMMLERALTQQPITGATYAGKLNKAEGQLDFSQPAAVLERRIRAFDPVPGCFCWVYAKNSSLMLKCWRAKVYQEGSIGLQAGRVGMVVGLGVDGPIIACGLDLLELIEVQQPGGRRLAASRWAQQHGLTIGDYFGDASGPAKPHDHEPT